VADLLARLPDAEASGNPTRILATIVAALTLGAIAFIAGVKVQRTGLCTYCVAGTSLDVLPGHDTPEDIAAELTYLAEERAAIQGEPSLRRAAEVVERQLLTGPRRLAGRFVVRSREIRTEQVDGRCTTHRAYHASWHGDWAETLSEQRLALDDLAAWATGMGMTASRVGYEVIATLPPAPTVSAPGLAKTRKIATATSRAARAA
jgi:hypothetical protein